MDPSSSRAPPPPSPRLSPPSPKRAGHSFHRLTSLDAAKHESSPAVRRKAQSAWSSRSNSPTRTDDSLGNRPRSKSSAALSSYFSPIPPEDAGQYNRGFPRPVSPETWSTRDNESPSPVLVPRVRSMTDFATLSQLQYPPLYVGPAYGAASAPVFRAPVPPAFGAPAAPPFGAPAAPPEASSRKEKWRAGLDEVNAKLGLLNRGRRKAPSYDTETETEPLPTARIPPPPTEKPPLALRLVPVFMFLCRLLSIVPAVLGTVYHLYLAYVTPFHHTQPSALDHLIASLWSVATGAWCYLLASGLLRRWLMYYPLPPTLIRQLSLQAICWSSTRITLQLFGTNCPLMAWVVIGTTTSFSNGVQIWVTSNIRLASSVAQKDGKDGRDKSKSLTVGASLDYWLGRRKINWPKVVKQCFIPLSILYSITTWALLVDREIARRG